MKHLIVPAGIGDLLWVLMKQEEPVTLEFCKSNKYRAWQLADLLPSLVVDYSESKRHTFDYNNISITQLNSHLEAGKRIEEYPGKTSWELPFETKEYKAEAGKLLKKPRGKKLVGIYTSSASHSWVRKNLAWQPSEWAKLIKQMQERNSKLEFAVFGAPYDADMLPTLEAEGVEFINCVGEQHLGVTLEAMKKCSGFVGFPSGIPILAHLLGLPTIMFFPHERRHYKMHNTFNRPESIEEGYWKGCSFPSYAHEIVAWMESAKPWAKLLSP